MLIATTVVTEEKPLSLFSVYGGVTCAPRTELDTHANMIVLGRQCYVLILYKVDTVMFNPMDMSLEV